MHQCHPSVLSSNGFRRSDCHSGDVHRSRNIHITYCLMETACMYTLSMDSLEDAGMYLIWFFLQYDDDDPIDPNQTPFNKFDWLYPKTTENFSSLHIEYGVNELFFLTCIWYK